MIEPIAIIEVKSKASGVITKMTGRDRHARQAGRSDRSDRHARRAEPVRPGQGVARRRRGQALRSPRATRSAMRRCSRRASSRRRSSSRSPSIIENAKSAVVSAQANLDLAKQSLEDATVKAPAEGTIIDKTVSEGTVIAVGDRLGQRRHDDRQDGRPRRRAHSRAVQRDATSATCIRAKPANVTVDAYPDRRFSGVVREDRAAGRRAAERHDVPGAREPRQQRSACSSRA